MIDLPPPYCYLHLDMASQKWTVHDEPGHMRVAVWTKNLIDATTASGLVDAKPISGGVSDEMVERVLTAWYREMGGIEPSKYWRCDQITAMRAALQSVLPTQQGEGYFDMAAHLQRQREWSERTFGPGARTQGVCDHIRKELLEVEADPLDVKEWADVVILALDGAWRCGASPQEIIATIVAKQTKNEGRTWPDWRTADPNKAIEHDRSADPVKCDAWSCNGGTVCGPYDNAMICGKCNGTGFKQEAALGREVGG